jgi:antitoxin component of MazEF toxin-antitoxin module
MVRGERLAAFSRERLDGAALPEDLRILATAQWEGVGHPFERFGITVLEPGERYLLTDHSYLTEQDRQDPDIMANCAAFERMTEFLKVVAVHEDGLCFGYWTHPRQRQDVPPPVVMVDTEGSFLVQAGRTLSEACLGEIAYEDDDLFAEVAEELARLGIPVSARSWADLAEVVADPAPEDVMEELYHAEVERRTA